jgi:hypothetical protein
LYFFAPEKIRRQIEINYFHLVEGILISIMLPTKEIYFFCYDKVGTAVNLLKIKESRLVVLHQSQATHQETS